MFYRLLIIFSPILILTSSCSNDDQPDTSELLNSSSWLGGTETQGLDYDASNNLIDEVIRETPDGQLHLFSLNADKSAVIKYECDRTKCDGKTHQGKWELKNNTLTVTINREEVNALADVIFIEASIHMINTSEMILEVEFEDPTPSVSRRVRRVKYVISE